MSATEWKKLFLPVLAFLLTLLCPGCGKEDNPRRMSMEEARKVIEAGTEDLIVDVRTREEYDTGHIPGALLVPVEDIREGKLDLLPDKDQAMMVYCRTGRRSADASSILAKNGYASVCDIGGFLDWKGRVETAGDAQP